MKYILMILVFTSFSVSHAVTKTTPVAKKTLDASFKNLKKQCEKEPAKYFDHLKKYDNEMYEFAKKIPEKKLETYLYGDSITGQTITNLGAYLFSPENKEAVPARACWNYYNNHFEFLKKQEVEKSNEEFIKWETCQENAYRGVYPEVIEVVMKCYKKSGSYQALEKSAPVEVIEEVPSAEVKPVEETIEQPTEKSPESESNKVE